MVHRYTITRYSFTEPNAITEGEYLQLKQQLQNDPSFTLLDKNDTITNQFSRLFKILAGAGICAVLLPIFWIAGDNNQNNFGNHNDNGFVTIGLLITMIWTVFGLFAFLMNATDLRTYAGYLKKKRAYFTDMEIQIRKSRNYDEFFDNFYK